jgi:uncharacterized Fe-S cluster-containing protein
MPKESPFACVMTDLTPEQRSRTFAILDELKAKRKEVKELPDGYAFRYTMDVDTFRNAAEFISYEYRCCPFFDFDLILEREGGDMWLQLTGRKGVKAFIREEFSVG